jgi:hypothetical protein
VDGDHRSDGRFLEASACLQAEDALTKGRAQKIVGHCPSDAGTPSLRGLTRLSVPMVVGPRTYHETFFIAITIVSAVVLRWPGAWVGDRLGIVAHHALGWFTAAIGSGIATLILKFAEGSGNFLDSLRGGSAYAILGGLLFATMVEVVIGSFEHLRPCYSGLHTNCAQVGSDVD